MKKIRICMLTDRLDLGGAETHIVTLANHLSKKGHEVTVISGGGRLVSSLFGVRHVTLPLYRKRSFLSLYFTLWRFLKREGFDVIHAHTRFSAFLCRGIARERLVTTAHWVFDTAFPKKQLSVWGRYTLAVSPDISAYLQENYKLPAERILVTVNGIDIERFYPKKGKDGPKKIVYCSRIDRDRADVAFLLLRVLKHLPSSDFTLTVLGDGNRFEELKKEVKTLLSACPQLSIRLEGGVCDVAPFLREADIFIGVSRAALEGMASGCVTLLAGNEGYLSIFSPQNAKEAEESNFCCRDTEAATEALLLRDLSYLLSLPKTRLWEMGEENRRYIIARYSASRMADDALSLYERICKGRCVLCGYYGFSNVGDVLLARALTMKLRREGYEKVHLLSARRLSPSAISALKRGYDLILGGGNLLQDKTSRRSLAFYLYFARRARRLTVYGGIGPLSAHGEEACAPLLMRAERVFCRTRGDLARARSLGAKNARLSFDTALALPFPRKEKGENILLALRAPLAGEEAPVCAFVLRLCRRFGKEKLLLFPMHPADRTFAKRLSRLAGILYREGDADEFLSCVAASRAVIASRLHAGICALGAGVPFLLWKEEEKCRFLVEDIRASVKESAFCGLFSYADRIDELPVSDGIEKARHAMNDRI